MRRVFAGEPHTPHQRHPGSLSLSSHEIFLPVPTHLLRHPRSHRMPASFEPIEDERYGPDDDGRLARHLWVKTFATPAERRGSRVYELLGPQASEELAWSRHIPVEGWRQRYKDYASEFDEIIERMQREAMAPRTEAVAAPAKPRTQSTKSTQLRVAP
ncbi:hypothetical protein C8R46DRAFT_1191560, partial [Mycena filopes]